MAAVLAHSHDGDLAGVEVPSCPGWSLETLTNHLGRVQRYATAAVRARGEAVPFPGRPPVIDHEWFEEGVAELAAALEEAGPEAPAWNFMGITPPEARFWFRRQAHELAVHRWDAEVARLGRDGANPIETELAIDGLDELLDVLLARAYGGGDLGGTVHLHATDSPHGEWLVTTSDGELLVGHDHQSGDATISGTASDLLLAMWGRVALDGGSLELHGDPALAERLREVLKAP